MSEHSERTNRHSKGRRHDGADTSGGHVEAAERPAHGGAAEGGGAVTAASPVAAALAPLQDTVERLSRASRQMFQNPYAVVDWPDAVDTDADWFFSPELSSLHGTDVWEQLDELGRKRLTFFEAINFFSLNIHGERMLMEGLAARLYRPDFVEVADYLHHFLDEENKHSIYFAGFCRRYARIYPTRQVMFGREMAPGEADVLFFTKVLIFEEIVDRYNLVQARDGRLHGLARFINQNHHVEETRHLIFGRRIVEALWRAWSPRWTGEQRDDIRAYVTQFFAATWREYYNPEVYRDAGLAAPWDVAEAAWTSAAQRRHRQRFSEKCSRALLDAGVLEEKPAS